MASGVDSAGKGRHTTSNHRRETGRGTKQRWQDRRGADAYLSKREKMNARTSGKKCVIPSRGQTPTRTEDEMPVDRVMVIGSDDEMLHSCRRMIQSSAASDIQMGSAAPQLGLLMLAYTLSEQSC